MSHSKEDEEIVHIPIDGVLDLHTFSPGEVPSLVDEYLRVCRKKDINKIQIIHGKGKGILRRTVHSILEKHPLVLDYRLDTGPSSWGATVVRLRRETKKRQ